jgi:hypothetical protein
MVAARRRLSPTEPDGNICSQMTRNLDEFAQVKQLCERDLSDYSIAHLTGVPRATAQRWRHRALPPGAGRAPARDDWRIIDDGAYCYLLGMYLGDGHVTHRPPNFGDSTLQLINAIRASPTKSLTRWWLRFQMADRRSGRRNGSASDVLSLSAPSNWWRFSAARPRSETPPPDRAHRLAARAHAQPFRTLHPRPDPL